jgi:hypothetical protein
VSHKKGRCHMAQHFYFHAAINPDYSSSSILNSSFIAAIWSFQIDVYIDQICHIFLGLARFFMVRRQSAK